MGRTLVAPAAGVFFARTHVFVRCARCYRGGMPRLKRHARRAADPCPRCKSPTLWAITVDVPGRGKKRRVFCKAIDGCAFTDDLEQRSRVF